PTLLESLEEIIPIPTRLYSGRPLSICWGGIVTTMPQSSPGRNRDEDPPNPHLVETVAKSSYDQRRVGTVTRIHLILTWSRPWQRVPMINAGSEP
ncbi:hypothetical protein ACLKA7_000678, partial [Drosophila subpalustris]